uniref:Uncharacterized protein n=1 Tax=Plectus sambesii TaxID=2011161 RepID=A0A914W227_9BILA
MLRTKIVALFCVVCLIGSASSVPLPNSNNIMDVVDPQMRSRFSDLLHSRLQMLSSESSPKRSSGALRNCFFSPVQCLLPVQRNDMLRRFGP